MNSVPPLSAATPPSSPVDAGERHGFGPNEAASLVTSLRAEHADGLARPLAFREDQLERMIRMIEENEAELTAALHADLGKPDIETYAGEIALTLAELKLMRRKLATWAAPERVKVPLSYQPGKAWIHREAKGVVLIIAPWNYPLQLSLLPLATAIAAGNAVVLKPSELAPAASRLIADIVSRTLDERLVRVVEGAVPETTALLEQRWDHIFYTGNGTVGRVVMRAAAEHLTPVTLELGGKSPAVVDHDARLKVAARRIVWGKFFNTGQTCVAPDYLLVHRDAHRELVGHMVDAIGEFYGEDPERSPDYGRIVNERHFRRLSDLIDAGGFARIAVGGQRNPGTRFVAPTILDETSLDAAVMQEEIFGPLLPVVVVDDVEDAIRIVADGEKTARALRVHRERGHRRPDRGGHVSGRHVCQPHHPPSRRAGATVRRHRRVGHRCLSRQVGLRRVQPPEVDSEASHQSRPARRLPAVRRSEEEGHSHGALGEPSGFRPRSRRTAPSPATLSGTGYHRTRGSMHPHRHRHSAVQ